MNSRYLSAALIAIGLPATALAANPVVQTVDVVNLTRNGAAVAGPVFVSAGDVIKFDALLTANGTTAAPAAGLGLCLEYKQSLLGDPTIRNLYNNNTLLANGQPSELNGCTAGNSTVVPGADWMVVKGWGTISDPFPGNPLPIKLYDAQFSVAATPKGLSRVGFGAIAVAGGVDSFITNGPIALCGKPTVSVNAISNGSEAGSVSATIAIALSAAIPVECGTSGAFPVTLTLAGTATVPGQPNADYSIGGARISGSGATVTASFPSDGLTTSLTFSAKPVSDGVNEGTETITLTVAAGSGNYVGIGAVATATISDGAAVATATVVEYLDTADFPTSPGGHFFYSSDPAEQAAVDGGAAGKFFRTTRTFKTGGSSPVCRFYGSVAPGPNSHFFTVNPDECNQLRTLQQTPTPAGIQQWNYERIEYATTPPVVTNGALTCPAGTAPVYRAYNNAFSPTGVKNPWDSNHRFTPVQADIAAMVSQGWRDEGVQFCTAP